MNTVKNSLPVAALVPLVIWVCFRANNLTLAPRIINRSCFATVFVFSPLPFSSNASQHLTQHHAPQQFQPTFSHEKFVHKTRATPALLRSEEHTSELQSRVH